MRIIDTHAHIFPEKIAQKAVESISAFYGGTPMRHAGTAEALLASGEAAGIEKYLVFSTATKAEQVEAINNFILEACAAHPQFIGLGTMHPGYAHFEEELARIRARGIKGIKLHPDFQQFNLDDARMEPVFDALVQNGMFLLTHSGDYRYDFSHPGRIAKVSHKFPQLRIIAAHCGGWQRWEEARAYLRLPNIYVDTSSTIPFAGGQAVLEAVDAFGSDHVFFGTDFPMFDHKESLEALLELGLPERELENILYYNFAAFYGSLK